ncbi:helix-turn-helix domain-containing protein [Kitasatospora sp. NPDC058243]|uniref:helix-turn-helix domain-containing protein n=1 Tax=Kitasatospora sp. NPDC058243 TaxID=3346397 RepID=UPI0036DE4F21
MDAGLIERVRQVIGSTGETQAVMAERMGISPDKLSKSLGGKRRFTSLELALIADFGGRTVDWLLRGVEPRTALGAAARKTGACEHTTDEVRRLLGRYEQVIDALARIGSDLPRRAHNRPGGIGGPQLAQAALAAVGVDPWTLSTQNLASSFEQAFGVEIAGVDLPDKLDGLSWSTDSFDLILVAKTNVWTRQRFTLAHELGHILAGDAHDEAVVEKVQPGRSTTAMEVQANAFAAEFLMPRTTVLADARDRTVGVDLVAELAWKYRVSPSAMATRLKVLGVLTADQRRQWGAMLTADGARIAGAAGALEQHMVNTERSQRGWHPRRLTELAIKAYASGDTTVRPLAALLDLDPDVLLDLLEPAQPEPEQQQAAPSDPGTELAFSP